MKSWMLKIRTTDKLIFYQLSNGSKMVETRAATVRYQPIQVGDELVFTCGKARLSKKVLKKEHFKSIDVMVKKISFNHIMPSVKSVSEMKKIYFSFPGYEEKISEFGIFAFYLK